MCYVIHIRSTAKENNVNFAGAVYDFWYGKKENNIGWLIKNQVESVVKDYAFSTKAAACRAMKAHDIKEKYWTSEIEVLTYEEAMEKYDPQFDPKY